jgi:PAS domain-containing protein
MGAADLTVFAQMLAAAVAAVVLGMVLLALLPGHLFSSRDGPLIDDNRNEAVFIFDGETMLDCSPEARAILATRMGRGSPWHRLTEWLTLTFPSADERLRHLGQQGRFTLASAADAPQTLVMQAELRGGLVRITISDAGGSDGKPGTDNNRTPPVSVALLIEEVEGLRDVALHTPWLCWRERLGGEVIWANAAYLLKLEDVLPEQAAIRWPLPGIFPIDGGVRRTGRQSVERRDGACDWYDVTTIDLDATRLCFALPADGAVRAESMLRDFMQNLTRAFSHVPVGLAIFDRQRRLTMFNPALTDLTGLPVELLSARPTLIAMLDAMRDRNLLPEPRDYRTWRRHLAGMEDASATGMYEDEWNMPGGQTYHVVGRPQPDGSLVLMIDDISTEMTRVQRYRADLDLGQAVIDTVDDAIAVFAPSGQLAMSNAAYGRLWGHDHGEGLESAAVSDLVGFWQSRGAPSPIWQRIADFVTRDGEAHAWEDITRLTDGRLIFCEVKAISGGATLATFRLAADPGEMATFTAMKRRA